MKEIIIWGLRRSGNHALGSFIMRHNKDVIKNISPLKEYKSLKKSKNYLNDYLKYGKISDKFPVPEPKMGDIQIISFENAGHRNTKHPEYTNILNDNSLLNFDTGRNVGRYIFVILRDPYNWFASYFNVIVGNEEEKAYMISLWISYAKSFFLNLKNSFWFPVNYNLLCKDIDYRKKISEYIEEPFNDEGINLIYSKASTFDKRYYQTNAQDMDVENRWKNIPNYNKKFLDNEELYTISKEIFGVII